MNKRNGSLTGDEVARFARSCARGDFRQAQLHTAVVHRRRQVNGETTVSQYFRADDMGMRSCLSEATRSSGSRFPSWLALMPSRDVPVWNSSDCGSIPAR